MEKISVLMSTFNESTIELGEAIESILNQDFTEFEFIIVNDNPKRKDLTEFLQSYSKKDKRIKVINNRENMGLAMSLNCAAKLASSQYYLRMDADDISLPGRLRKQYNLIKTGLYDCICSDFEVMDNHGLIKQRSGKFYTSDEIRSYLPYENIMHHPTIIMTRKIFDKVGGYRNFLCSQDYDLWLRFLDNDCRFYMMNEKLLYYRKRENSITSTIKMKQKYTSDYIRILFMQRLQNGQDNYSYDNYLAYLKKNKVGDEIKEKRFMKYNMILSKANRLIQDRRHVLGYLLRLKVFILSGSYRQSYVRKFIMKRIIIKQNKCY